MREHSSLKRPIGIVAAGVCTLGLAVLGDAAAQPPKPEVQVAVFAGHYVLAGRLIDDLDVLESAVRATHARAITLDACGAGTARAQMAAAHRFRHLYMELHVRDLDSPGCMTALAPQVVSVSHRLGERPFGIDDAAVGRWWYDLMP